MTTTIKKLKKGDKFTYDNQTYTVTKRYVDDEHPLKAIHQHKEHLFHYDELVVEKILE